MGPTMMNCRKICHKITSSATGCSLPRPADEPAPSLPSNAYASKQDWPINTYRKHRNVTVRRTLFMHEVSEAVVVPRAFMILVLRPAHTLTCLNKRTRCWGAMSAQDRGFTSEKLLDAQLLVGLRLARPYENPGRCVSFPTAGILGRKIEPPCCRMVPIVERVLSRSLDVWDIRPQVWEAQDVG